MWKFSNSWVKTCRTLAMRGEALARQQHNVYVESENGFARREQEMFSTCHRYSQAMQMVLSWTQERYSESLLLCTVGHILFVFRVTFKLPARPTETRKATQEWLKSVPKNRNIKSCIHVYFSHPQCEMLLTWIGSIPCLHMCIDFTAKISQAKNFQQL